MRLSLPSFEMLNPRKLRSSGRATALFASLTFSLSLPVRNPGQLSLGVLPRSAHELQVLLAAPNRSGL
jgi:hypothetical protein